VGEVWKDIDINVFYYFELCNNEPNKIGEQAKGAVVIISKYDIIFTERCLISNMGILIAKSLIPKLKL